MAASEPIKSAIALELLATLERYRDRIDGFADPFHEMERYDELSRAFNQLCVLSHSVPEVSAAVVELLIAHVELIDALSLSASGKRVGDCRAVRDRHVHALQRVETLLARRVRPAMRADRHLAC